MVKSESGRTLNGGGEEITVIAGEEGPSEAGAEPGVHPSGGMAPHSSAHQPGGAEPTATGHVSGTHPHNVNEIHTEPATEESEKALEARLKKGDGTPEEACEYFKRHGYPWLTTLPTWDATTNRWLFSEWNPLGGQSESSGSGIGFDSGEEPGGIQTGEVVERGPSLISTGSPTGGGTRGGGAAHGPRGSQESPHSSGGGTDSPGGARPGSDGNQTAVGHIDTSGYTGGPAVVDPDAETDDFGGVVGPDGKPLAPPISHFADNELSGAIYDALDKDNPLITRAILAALVPAASVGVLVERYFVNPLLAAPAHLYAFAVLEGRAAEAAASGDVTVAAQTHVEASRQLREAALAIASVLPIGRGAATAERLAARGIVFDGVRGISRVTNVPLWARAQMWVTGAKFEYKFIVNGEVTMVDGFMSRTGERTVKNAADWVLVEVKTDGAIMRALRDPEYASAMINQLERYIKLGKDLEVGGVRYVIVESAEGGPASQMFRTFVEKTYKTLVKSGFLEIYWTPMPP